MTRAEDLLLLWALGAFGSFIPYTAMFGNLPEEKSVWPDRAMIAWQILWALALTYVLVFQR